jgi:hypothetical protein
MGAGGGFDGRGRTEGGGRGASAVWANASVSAGTGARTVGGADGSGIAGRALAAGALCGQACATNGDGVIVVTMSSKGCRESPTRVTSSDVGSAE